MRIAATLGQNAAIDVRSLMRVTLFISREKYGMIGSMLMLKPVRQRLLLRYWAFGRRSNAAVRPVRRAGITESVAVPARCRQDVRMRCRFRAAA